ncbi:hypothetical protein CGL27_16505 [Streptomyces sp. 11-1-2]|nr:hypothetical protein CGL27_16505 [Streptomyces sp. 11-1-2]
MGVDTLAYVLAKLQDWEPLRDSIYEDLADALDVQAPPRDAIDGLVERIQGSLTQLVTIALAGHAGRTDREAALLIERANDLHSETVPGSYWKAVGHLRQLGWVTNELLERLSRTGYIDVAS